MFYRLAKIDQNDPNFIDACDSMGWDGDSWKEVWNELSKEDGYIVNYNHEVERVKCVDDVVDVSVFCTCGGRWYEVNVPAMLQKDGYMYVKDKYVDEF